MYRNEINVYDKTHGARNTIKRKKTFYVQNQKYETHLPNVMVNKYVCMYL